MRPFTRGSRASAPNTCRYAVVPSPVRFPVLREVLQWQPHLASDPALHWFREVVKRAAQDIAPLGRKHGRAAV
ncbi:MAG: hypothetical protein WCF49_09875 [Xanthobacteraceae bacterium]